MFYTSRFCLNRKFLCTIISATFLQNVHCLHDFYCPWKTKNNLIRPKICLHFSFSFVFSFVSFVVVPMPNMNTHILCGNMTVCEETFSPKSYRYHPGLWSGKKWSCCKTVNRTAFGCQAATHWIEANNNPSPSKLSSALLFLVIRLCIHCAERNNNGISVSDIIKKIL